MTDAYRHLLEGHEAEAPRLNYSTLRIARYTASRCAETPL
jgi:hypothetical protein